MHKVLAKVGSIIIVLGLFLNACSDQNNPATAINENDSTESLEIIDNIEARANHQESNVYTLPPDPILIDEANATLVRNKNGVRVNIRTNDLVPRNTYSVWMVVFDAPENCEVPNECTLDDLGNPVGPMATVFGAVGGGLAGGNGQATFASHAKPGDEANDVLLGDGSLDNPLTAEIHLVIRTHGPAIPGMINEQTATYNAGCELGEPNEGLCEDLQFTVFPPPDEI